MFHIVLYQPEIPPNTGNIIRLCANTGACLHLIRPLGFTLDDRRLRRAGLDYHELASGVLHDSLEDFLAAIHPPSLFAISTHGGKIYCEASFRANDALLFGSETRGLPGNLLAALPADRILRIPMHGASRSLNLSNAVAVVLYEALRQNGFQGL